MKVPQLQIRFPCKQNLEKFRPFPIFFRPYLSQIAPQEYLERINRFVSFLDPGNVKIATAMKKYGLRNLQLIADKTRIPRPTVDARGSRLEKKWLLRTWIQELAAQPLHTQRKENELGGGFDKKDLIILKELVKDGRTKLTQLARLLDMTVPAVKYRFDNL